MVARFSVSRKLLLLLGGMACAALILVLAIHVMEQRQLGLVLSDKTTDKKQFAEEVVRLSGESLETFANDYSCWTEMVQYVQAPDSDWAEVNIDPSLKTYSTDAAWVFTPNAVLVYATAVPALEGLLQDSLLTRALANTILTEQFLHYYVVTRSGLLEIRSAPIQPSDDVTRQVTPAGYFVVGRVWNDQYLATMARRIDAGLRLAAAGDSLLCATGLKDALKAESYQVPLTLPGPNRLPAATLTAVTYSPIMAALDSDIRTRSLIMVVLSLIMFAIFGYFVRRWVSRPLHQVLVGLMSEDERVLAALGDNESEFGAIAERIISSIAERQKLREQEARLTASEVRIKTIVELTGQILYDTDAITGVISYMGPLEEITGYAPQAFPGSTLTGWQSLIHPDDLERVAHLRSAAIQSTEPFCMEYRIQRPDGIFITVEQSGCAMPDDQSRGLHLVGTVKNITAQRDAEAALKSSERFLASIVDNIPTMLFVKDAVDLRFIMFNQVGATMLGHSEDDFVGKNDYDFFRKEDADFFTAKDRAVLDGRRLVDIPEERISTKSGGERVLHTRKIPIFDESGEARYLLGISEDITDKMLFEQKLRVSENKFRTIFDHAPDATLLIDQTIVDCNEKACLLFGYSRGELVDRPLQELAPKTQPGGRLSVEAGLEYISLARQGRFATFYWKIQNSNGETMDTEITVTSMGIDERVVLLVSIRDISRRLRAEKKVRLLAAAAAQLAEGLVITDLEGSIEYVNPAFERMTQYSFAEAVGNNPRLLKSDKQDGVFYRDMWDTLLDGKTWQGRLENKRKDGTTYLENATISPVVDQDGNCTHFVAVKRDVSHEVALEGMLLQSQKMEAIGRLAGGVAHDFNNILTAILGYSDILVRRLKDDAQLRSDAEEIKKAATRASGLTKQLLAFSRRQTNQKQTVNMFNLVTDMVPMLKQLVGEGIAIDVKSDAPELMVLADPTHLQQVILNLAVNAKDAMLLGGSLCFRVFEEQLSDQRSVGKLELPPGDYVLLEAADTGKGMDESVIAHLFEPFFTTKEIGKGTGLGLATVYGIVEQSGGAIAVRSKVDHGTTFTVYLPKLTPSIEPEPSRDTATTVLA